MALFSAYSQTSLAGRPEDILWELIKNGWANYSPGTRLQYANYVIDSFDRHSAANAQPILKCCQEAFALVPTLGGARLVDDPLLAVSADSDVGWKSIFWFLAATGCHPRDMWNVSRQDFVFQTTALRVSWRIRKTHCDRASIVEDALYLYAWSCPPPSEVKSWLLRSVEIFPLRRTAACINARLKLLGVRTTDQTKHATSTSWRHRMEGVLTGATPRLDDVEYVRLMGHSRKTGRVFYNKVDTRPVKKRSKRASTHVGKIQTSRQF